MAFQYPYGNYYQPQIQQPQQYQPQLQIQPQQTINWVSGESGAKSWMVGRNETVLLMDSESQCFYLKSADASGMPLPLRVFDYTERAQNNAQGSNSALFMHDDKFITRDEFDDLRAKCEELEKQIRKPSTAKKKEVIEDE